MGFQKSNEILEVTYKENYKILDRVEFALNNPKDKRRLLEYIREKMGLTFSKDDKVQWW